MNRRELLKSSLSLLGGLSLAQTGSLAASDEDYYDKTVPRDPAQIPLAPYSGERYEAEVPDTLDLAEYANETINYLTRAIAPEEWDYSIYHIMALNINPAILRIGDGALQNQNAKWSEAIVLMRTASGSTYNQDEDRKLVGALVRITGKDGLCYVPVKDRPWAFIDPVTAKIGKPYADIFGEGRQLRAYETWYEHGKDPFWRRLADRKAERLLEITVQKGDTRYFKSSRGYSPWYKETGEGPVVALGDVGAVYKTMQGDAAANIVAWSPQAAAVWYRLTAYKPALELAEGLARYLYSDPEFYDADTRFFPTLVHGHPTLFSHCIDSMLSYALVTEDREKVKWAERAYRQWMDLADPGRTGMAFATEACQIADMIQVGCMLSRNGVADYWEDVDRLVRNSLAAMQITQQDIDRFKSQPVSRAGDPNNTAIFTTLTINNQPIPLNKPLPPGYFQSDDSTDRCRGAWFPSLDGRNISIGCCDGNMCRGLYLAWDSIVESQGEQLKVNLLMNRASSWADIDSYIPYEGRVVIQMKTHCADVLVRIPEWTNWDEVSCRVNGNPRLYGWSAHARGYVAVGSVQRGDKIMIEFPMKQWVVSTKVPVGRTGKIAEYRATLKGNTVIDFTGDLRYPLHTHEKYRTERAATRKVRRFVSQERFVWW